MKLYIKYMVSLRCILVVKAALEELGIKCTQVILGEADVTDIIPETKRKQLRIFLLKSSLELMDDQKSVLIEKIKSVIIEMVHYSDEACREKFSIYLSEKLHQDYAYMSSLFSEVKGITIEHYIIAHKIEKIKELLLYDELNLTEISYLLNYSSVAHLSNQFKKVTGLTPSYFKKMKEYKRRISLEDL